MNRFAKSEFMKHGDMSRGILCRDLAQLLARDLRGGPGFHDRVQELVSQLRLLGHDLWSFDESDEMEIWSPNYQTPSGPGIVVTFRPDHVDVEWSDQ